VSKQVFPVLIDVEHPAFLKHLRHLQSLSARIMALQEQGIVGRIKALPLQLRVGATFARMYFLPTQTNTLPDELRMAAAW
jgi:magnesium-protoporphyrin IX monomethyl ester (oxidative) cyclase